MNCRYGPLRNVWVARNPPGFAFVEFEDPRDAEDSVKALDGTYVVFIYTFKTAYGLKCIMGKSIASLKHGM